MNKVIKLFKLPLVYFLASLVIFYFAYISDSIGNELLLRYIPGLLLLVISACGLVYNIQKMINPNKYILTNEDFDKLCNNLIKLSEKISSIKIEKSNLSLFIRSLKEETNYFEIMYVESGLIILSDTERHEHFDYVHTEPKDVFFEKVFNELKIILDIQKMLTKEELAIWDEFISELKK